MRPVFYETKSLGVGVEIDWGGLLDTLMI